MFYCLIDGIASSNRVTDEDLRILVFPAYTTSRGVVQSKPSDSLHHWHATIRRDSVVQVEVGIATALGVVEHTPLSHQFRVVTRGFQQRMGSNTLRRSLPSNGTFIAQPGSRRSFSLRRPWKRCTFTACGKFLIPESRNSS